jgi:hypothetical protein
VSASPFVLFIDDSDQELWVHQMSALGVEAAYRHPQDLTFADLGRATLILVDEFLEDWPQRAAREDQPAEFVRDGIGLAALLRSHLDGRGASGASAQTPSRTAIALRTGDLDRLAGGIPMALRPIAVAARHDLEWVFEKNRASPEQFLDLAVAAADLPRLWDPADLTEQVRWLGLSEDNAWYGRAVAQIERCRPPWSQLATADAGRPWLGWFLQRILPYSTFLVDDARAAALLGLKVESFALVASETNPLAERLHSVRYAGHLSDIAGRRWWRAGLQALSEELVEMGADDTSRSLAAAAASIAGEDLDSLNCDDPVFIIDDQYQVSPQPISAQDAVRLQPDGWPVYADPAWLDATDTDPDSPLRALVVLDDRDLLEVE